MADELLQTLLSKATSIGPDPYGAEETWNRYGGMMGASMPQNGPPGAIEELMKLLVGFKPSKVDPTKLLGATRVTGRRVPPPTEISLPKGLEAPSPTFSRDPSIMQRYATQVQKDAEIAANKPRVNFGRWNRQAGNRKMMKLTPEDVLSISEARKAGVKLNDLTEKFPHVSRSTLMGIFYGTNR